MIRGLITAFLALWPVLAGAASVEDLSRALRLEELTTLMRDEGVEDSRRILPRGPSGKVPAGAIAQVETLFDPEVFRHEMEDALTAGLDPAELDAATDFFRSTAGQALVQLELQARAAIANEDVEAAARGHWAERQAETSDEIVHLKRFAEVNGLLDRNTTSTMTARYHFLLGLADGADRRADEAEILSRIWSREAEIRTDTEGWLMGYLLLAYGPADPGDLAAYVAFSETPAGAAVNAALFDGFGVAYERISYGLGLVAGRAAAAQDL